MSPEEVMEIEAAIAARGLPVGERSHSSFGAVTAITFALGPFKCVVMPTTPHIRFGEGRTAVARFGSDQTYEAAIDEMVVWVQDRLRETLLAVASRIAASSPERRAAAPDVAPATPAEEGRFVVRLYDGFDNRWIDITGPVTRAEADRVWSEKTKGGTEKTTFNDIDYFRIFPADTRMLYRSGGPVDREEP